MDIKLELVVVELKETNKFVIEYWTVEEYELVWYNRVGGNMNLFKEKRRK